MVEMFYGPWRVAFTKSDPARRNRLVILGSDGMDGAYERTFGGDDVVLEVTGSTWSADIESSPRNQDAWESCLRERHTSYSEPDGLTVTLLGHSGDLEEMRLGNVVRCVSRDPDLNPPPTPDPFDFTYPHG